MELEPEAPFGEERDATFELKQTFRLCAIFALADEQENDTVLAHSSRDRVADFTRKVRGGALKRVSAQRFLERIERSCGAS